MTGTAPWTVKHPDPALVSRLARAIGLSDITCACLVNRGITDADRAHAFLRPRLADLKPPDGMADLDRAAGRLADAVMRHERIGVFGDYDVDGISSAALVVLFLNKLGAEVAPLIADRFLGYGMGEAAIDFFANHNCSLIIAVDCGTSDHAAATYAKERNMDVLIVDHHRVDGPHPEVVAFVNPERKDCGFGDTSHAAVGIAFYFAAAARSELQRRGHIKKEDVNLKAFLDLVALGTVADVMPLTGNNRILVSHGLLQMSHSPRQALQWLIRIARIRSNEIRSSHIAYQFAPRLNAAGRLSQAKDAFELLIAEDSSEAEKLVVRLDQLSRQRRVLEEQVIEAAEHEIAAQHLMDQHVIVVAGDGWHRGVLGIVASRLLERMNKPVYIIGFDGDVGAGSARGFGQLNLHNSLTAAAHHLVRYGGHQDAAGFTVNKSALPAFKQALQSYAKDNCKTSAERTIVCDALLKPSEITSQLVREIGRLGPFGTQNEEPIFDVNGLYILEKRVVGRDHLKLTLKTPSGTIGAFGPRMGTLVHDLSPLIRVAANAIADEWRGDGTPELKLVAPPIPGT
ncbi:MAG: single-stranded-DNA-specific exonuclease RecJ [Myxococcota bacterium]|nr:single-stranded-DNA-specific exonuclease RecJ [Myxococcota bacterium]